MSRLRDALTVELTKKVAQHGLVLWQDDLAEYADVAAELCPHETAYAAFDGSWYELRHRIERYLAGDERPRLVVYVPAPPPAEDPLLEVRVAAHRYVRRLRTLVEMTHSGELSQRRIAEVATQAKTILDAETALQEGATADVRLIRLLGTAHPPTAALRILNGERDEALDQADAWSIAAEFLATRFGGVLRGERDELRQAVARQLMLTEIAAAAPLPEPMRPSWTPPTVDQQRATIELLALWRVGMGTTSTYPRLASKVDTDLALATHLSWQDGLASCVTTAAVEVVAQRHAVSLLKRESWGAAAGLARDRQASPWCRPDAGDDDWPGRASRWRAIEAIADLRQSLTKNSVPASGNAREILAWYVADGWRIDRAHRRFELARADLDAYGGLEEHIGQSQAHYERWLDTCMLAASAAIETHGLGPAGLAQQGDIHDTWVRDADGLVAYVWVDALRYELGRELADQLASVAGTVQVHAAIAAAPTITSVGMTNLTPDAASRLALTMRDTKLRVTINGATIATVTDRVKQLRAAHGDRVVDRQLDLIAGQGEHDLRRSFDGAGLVLIRSTELDASGESGMLQAVWPQFSQIVQMLAKVVARLGHAGVRRVVIAADHGFVTLPRRLGNDRGIDPPAGGKGELHRRVWIGHGGTTVASTLRIPLAATGVSGDVDLIVPRGLAIFRGSGARQFFHGGISPQELVVPVIVVDFEETTSPPALKVDIAVAGGRITTGTFAATVSFDGDLFTSEVAVRAVAQRTDGQVIVARVVSGDGFDPSSGVVMVRSDQHAVLAFQLTANLASGEMVRVEALDAGTGVVLGTTEAPVAATIVVEDDLA